MNLPDEEVRRRQRSRLLPTALLLAFLVVLIYLIAFARMAG